MIRIAALALIASSLCTKAHAEDCTLDNNYCVPLFACTTDGGAFYVGRTYGRREGTVTARGPDGVACEGRWWRTALGAGRADFSCSDGRTGRATFTYFDRDTGTARGRGQTSDGARLWFWSGRKVMKFVASRRNVDTDLLQCVQNAVRAQQ